MALSSIQLIMAGGITNAQRGLAPPTGVAVPSGAPAKAGVTVEKPVYYGHKITQGGVVVSEGTAGTQAEADAYNAAFKAKQDTQAASDALQSAITTAKDAQANAWSEAHQNLSAEEQAKQNPYLTAQQRADFATMAKEQADLGSGEDPYPIPSGNAFISADGGTAPPANLYTVGPGTYFSPFDGEVAKTFHGDVQFDLFSFWIVHKFNPPGGSEWAAHIADQMWNNHGSAQGVKQSRAHWGGAFGNRTTMVTAELLYAARVVDFDWPVERIRADVLAKDPELFKMTTRDAFVTSYGFNILHPSVDAGAWLASVGTAVVGAVMAVVGVVTLNLPLAAKAVGEVVTGVVASIQNAGEQGVSVPHDLGAGAALFAALQAPSVKVVTPPPAPQALPLLLLFAAAGAAALFLL
jgi:hypothetical protein